MKFMRITVCDLLPRKLIVVGTSVSVCLYVLLGGTDFLQAWFTPARAAESKNTASSRPVARLSGSSTTRFDNFGNQAINFSAGRDLVTSYEGTTEAVAALESNEAAALSSASEDFDEDGVPDIVFGYGSSTGGILTLHRGNVDSIHQNSPEAQQRRAHGSFTEAPFLAPARVFDSPEAPELVGAGDFDADDHRDVIVTRSGSHAIWFYAGDGHGGFAEPRRIILPGGVTALEVGEINRRDGLADFVVGITSQTGSTAIVFESPLGAVNAVPEEFELPAQAASLSLGDIVNGSEIDLAIAAGNQLVLVNGRDRKLSFDTTNHSQATQPEIYNRSFPFNIKSIAFARFKGGSSTDIAILGDDGSVRLCVNPASNSARRKKTSLADWQIESLEIDRRPMASKIVVARISSGSTDSILVLDPESRSVNIIDQISEAKSRKAGSISASVGRLAIASVATETEPAAVLTMRLNGDALQDIVILRRSQSQPSLLTSAPLATFTVTNTGDNGGVNPLPGAGTGTLRQAIVDANANPGLDTINFILVSGPQTITPVAAFPTITEAVTIDGTTQTGFLGTPIIEIDGTNMPDSGLVLTGGNSTVRGLVINRLPGPNGAAIQTQSNGNNIIEGNFVGTNISGTAVLANNMPGVLSSFKPLGDLIGGTVAASRNLISGNGGSAISMIAGSSNNIVQGNFIGTDVTGTTALGNGDAGILAGITDNNQTIGGTSPGARNVISGCVLSAVSINGSGSLIQGNLFGTDVNGAVSLGNLHGVSLLTNTALGNTIGGVTAGARNVISGNLSHGVFIQLDAANNLVQGNFIGTNASGTAAIPNSTNGVEIIGCTNNTIGGTVAGAGNVISGNFNSGVMIRFGATGNSVQGNLVGTNSAGTAAVPNGNGPNDAGVRISIATNNTIGGTAAGAGNIISGNAVLGIGIDNGASGNQVQGNFVGTNPAGTAALGNTASGIVVNASSNNTIGGTSAAARNVVSGNVDGLRVDNGSTNNIVQGNFVGTDVTGTIAIPNSSFGIIVTSAQSNLIGGTVAGTRNVLSGNGFSGINLFTGLFPGVSSNNTVQGNFIGVNAAGTAALPNAISGFRINGGVNNIIGGTAAGAGNVVSGNPLGFTFLNNANGNTVQGNFIGTQANGTTPLPNTGDGINLDTSSSTNTIGGTAAGAANIIAFNGGRGINVLSGAGNTFLTNAIFSNVSLGIDLSGDGVTPNDAGDGDTGANNLQNFPVLTSATPGANTAIQGSLDSTPGTLFRIEFFSNPACDASGNGQGTTFLGFTNVTTNGSGNAIINVLFPVSVPAGNVVVATATDPSNNTSEFSACVTVAAASCTITCPANQTVSTAVNQCGAVVNYPPPSTTGVCGTVTCSPATGSFFSTGVTTVNCTTGAGPGCSFTVTVTDNQNPVIACPPNQNVNSTSPTPVSYPPPTVGDNCPGSTLSCAPASGSTFPVGTTTVNCTATDASSNSASCSFTVTVSGCAITCPPNQTISASPNQCGANVSYSAPTTTGTCGPVSCSPVTGSFFAVGTTNVICVVSGGPTCSFTVTVLDNQPPVLSCPANIVKINDPGKSTAVIDYVPAAISDNCPGATRICLPPSGFVAPIGTTTVTCTASDASHNTSACSFNVTVVDSESPGLRCPANISTNVGPTQTSAIVNYSPPVVSDNFSGPTAACTPASGATFPLGITTVVCTARDAAGNQATCGFTVTVTGGVPTGRFIIPGGGPVIEFGNVSPVTVKRKPKKGASPCGLFAIENSGFAALQLTLGSINRAGADVESGRIADPAEGELFELSEVSSNGSLTQIPIGASLVIAVGGQKNFCLKFKPGIPGLAGATTGLRAPQAIPDVVNSRVSFSVTGGPPLIANVISRVDTAITLINPKNPRKAPFASLSSSGDILSVTFAVYDPNLDVRKATFEFLNAAGTTVAGPFDIDLAQPVRDQNLVRGQSFSVEQRFTGARSNPGITGVRVKVSDGQSESVVSTSSLADIISFSARSQKETIIRLAPVHLTATSE